MKSKAPKQTAENRSICYIVLYEFRDTLSLLTLLFLPFQMPINIIMSSKSKFAFYYCTPRAKVNLLYFKSFKAFDLNEYIRRICGVCSQFPSKSFRRHSYKSSCCRINKDSKWSGLN